MGALRGAQVLDRLMTKGKISKKGGKQLNSLAGDMSKDCLAVWMGVSVRTAVGNLGGTLPLPHVCV